jgi:hypothetical protein
MNINSDRIAFRFRSDNVALYKIVTRFYSDLLTPGLIIDESDQHLTVAIIIRKYMNH